MAKEEKTYGGKVIGQALKEEGIEKLFGIHGVINLPVEEANKQGIRMYHFRHEQSAGFAADAYARTLRRPGVCFASTGAGFTNYVSAISQAYWTYSPVLLMIGQHGVALDKLGAAQEAYGAEVFKTITKYTHRCVDWNMNAFWIRKALRDCMTYPQGPIVLEFPITNLNAKGPNEQQKYIPKEQVAEVTMSQGDPAEIERATEMLINAKRPLLVSGDGVYWSYGEKELKELSELLQIPVHSRRTGRGAVSEDHPLAVTGATRGPLLRSADVICIISLRASFLEEWFEPPAWPRKAKYIQVHEIANDIWPGLPTEIGIVGSSKLVLRQMIDCARSLLKEPPDRNEWIKVLNQSRQKAFTKEKEAVDSYKETKGQVHPHVLGEAIATVLDDDSTVIYDSFTATGYLTDKLKVKYAGQVLDAGIHQALGQGIGMALGSYVARPGRQVLSLMGDGGFGISAMDMETLLRYKIPAVIVLFNNSSWGGNSIGQSAFYPQMDSWDNLPGIRYDKMFKELGCHTEHVTNPADVVPALERAFNSDLPSLVHVVGDSDRVHPMRLRSNFRDLWSREDIKQLPEALNELKKAGPMGVIRTEKSCRDYGLHIPMEELAEIAGIPMEQINELLEKIEQV